MFVGHRRTLDGDERAIGCETERVNQLCQKRLAGSGLADDQDR